MRQFHAAAAGAAAQRRSSSCTSTAPGIWDLGRGEFSLDARSTTRGSRSSRSRRRRRAAARVASGDERSSCSPRAATTPSSPRPPGFPKLERLKISLADTEHLKLLLTGYVAITLEHDASSARGSTSSSRLRRLQLRGQLSFDALWEPTTSRFVVDFDVEIKIKYQGTHVLRRRRLGPLHRPGAQARRRASGRSTCGCSRSASRSTRPSATTARRPRCPPVDPLPALVAALQGPAQLDAPPAAAARTRRHPAQRPGAAATCSCIRSGALERAPAGAAARDPDRPLRRRRAGGRPRFDITQAPSAGSRSPPRQPLDDAFAAGDFLELSDDEKLARPSFEAMPAGVALSSGEHRLRRHARPPSRRWTSTTASSAPTAPRPARPRALRHRPACRLRRRRSGRPRVAAARHRAPTASRRPARGSSVRRRSASWSRGVDDLAPRRRIAGAGSFTAAAQALDAHLAENPATAERSRSSPRSTRRRAREPARTMLPVPAVGARGRGERLHERRPAQAGARAAGREPPLARSRQAQRSTTARRATSPLRLYGPGDVIGIDPRAVIRADPPPRIGRLRAELPRRRSSSTRPTSRGCSRPPPPAQNGRLRPWLVPRRRRASTPSTLRLSRDRPLPALVDAGARAARPARVVGVGARPGRPGRTPASRSREILSVRAGARTSRGCSARAGSSRRRRYLACVVPAFEAGRKAGLGRAVTEADENQLAPAWTATRRRSQLPVYYHWEFATGAGGDFESLARRLTARRPRPTSGAGRCASATSRSACPTSACARVRGPAARSSDRRPRRRSTRVFRQRAARRC